ncbi:hypothetical protein [Pseudomonas arcuscaelestis]|uniref:hypothetical protein n=1 Tax=Pseudomonas arcuscaelestis TaxID=2710591 RepID=UPI00193DDE50|nr:hypothetical protein [Pseudomonas arcuscaelestis]MBM3113739.1 hypothetical protein [Pseudomonas arcuscaelestis]
MTIKKTVTMIYKHLNFKNDKFGKAKLFKSVAHSLRIAPSESNQIISTKILEWDEDKSDENLVFASSVSSQIIKLNSLTDEQKKTIQESFIHKVDAEQKSKNEKSDAVDALSKYKAKVNKWHNSITDNSDNLKIFLAKILEEKEIFDIGKEINQLSEFEFARKNQKTETVKKFLQLHNEVIENKSDIARNKVFIQEAFFKIPAHNNVEIKSEHMIFSITSFYTENLPDYPVKLVVYHGDEIGNHPHIFVEAKNKRTNKYDLLNAQKQFVNDNIEKVKAEYPDAEKLDFSNRSYSAKKLQAQYFQTLFYQHTNKMLLQYNVEAKKLDKTKEHNERMRKIEEDAKKPKIEREASFYNAQLNELEKRNELLIKQKTSLEGKNKNLEEEEKDLTKSIRDKSFKSEVAQQELEALETRVEARTEDLKSLNNSYNELSKSFENLQDKYNSFADNFKEMYQSAQKQMFDSVRNILSAVWSASAWGKDKFTFSIFSNVMKGAPADLQEFDRRVDEVKKFNSAESIDLYLDTDFLTSNDKIAQKFKEKLREKNSQNTENSRRVFFKNADAVLEELENNEITLASQARTKEQKDKLLKYK